MAKEMLKPRQAKMNRKATGKRRNIIINSSNKAILAYDYVLYKNIFLKAKGLMFSRKRTIVFEFNDEKIIPLHMFFVFFPIDVLFLDKSRRIVELKQNFMPFSFYTPKNRAKYVVELNNGTIAKTNTKAGDLVYF